MNDDFLIIKSGISENSAGAIQYGERTKNPDISVMIPTYKRMSLLDKAIHSVTNQITNYNYEIVVVDNNPDTPICEIEMLLRKYSNNLSYYKNEENIGMFGNWNRCVLLAQSDWIIVLSDDDELEQNYISNMLDTAKKIPDCGAITCRYDQIDANERRISKSRHEFAGNRIVKLNLQDFYWDHPTAFFGCLFRKDVAIKIGGFRPEYYPCSDAVFLMNICTVSSLYLLNEELFHYRWADNESMNKETQINFLSFNDKKSKILNNKLCIHNKRFDNFYRMGVIDSSMVDLLKTGAICKNDVQEILQRLGRADNISRIRAIFIKIIRKCKRIALGFRH